jgi:hypothetical protein
VVGERWIQIKILNVQKNKILNMFYFLIKKISFFRPFKKLTKLSNLLGTCVILIKNLKMSIVKNSPYCTFYRPRNFHGVQTCK